MANGTTSFDKSIARQPIARFDQTAASDFLQDLRGRKSVQIARRADFIGNRHLSPRRRRGKKITVPASARRASPRPSGDGWWRCRATDRRHATGGVC
jgi:hypothetical protein